MAENKQHFQHIMLYYFKKDKNTTETHTKVYRKGALTDRMCQKCFVKFRAGHFSLDDAPWSSKPVEVDSDPIETLIENSQCCTTQEIADILKISKSIVIVENEKRVSYFMEETKGTFCPIQYFIKSGKMVKSFYKDFV